MTECHATLLSCFIATFRSPKLSVRCSLEKARDIAVTLIDEAIAARAHVQVWWALRSLAIPRFLPPYEPQVKAVLGIRSQSLAHDEQGMPRHEVYKIHGMTPNQLRSLIDAVADVMNNIAASVGIANGVFDGDRLEKATLSMLATLARTRGK